MVATYVPGPHGPMVFASTSGGAFTPASLTGLLAWYKADAGTFSDLGSTPATNGGTIEQWNDQSGNGFHLKQTTSALRPTFLTNTLNSLPVVNLSNVSLNQNMQTALSSVTLGGTVLSTFILAKMTALNGTTNARILGASSSSDDTASDGTIMYLPGSSLTTVTVFNAANKSTGTISSGSWNQLGSIFDGANNTLYIANGAQTPVAATPTFVASANINLFCDQGGSSTLTGQVAEIVVTKSAMSSTDRNSLASYLTARWGI